MGKRIGGVVSGPIKGYPRSLLPPQAAKRAWRPPPITLEYVDTESANVDLRLGRGDNGIELFHRRSRQNVADVVQKHLEDLNIPSLMDQTRQRLEEQVSFVKERLEARYGLGEQEAKAEASAGPEAQGHRMAKFAIGLFDHFLEASKAASPEVEPATRRQEFVAMVRDAVKSSLEETRSALGGLDALDDELSGRLERIFDTFDARLESFGQGG